MAPLFAIGNMNDLVRIEVDLFLAGYDLLITHHFAIGAPTNLHRRWRQHEIAPDGGLSVQPLNAKARRRNGVRAAYFGNEDVVVFDQVFGDFPEELYRWHTGGFSQKGQALANVLFGLFVSGFQPPAFFEDQIDVFADSLKQIGIG